MSKLWFYKLNFLVSVRLEQDATGHREGAPEESFSLSQLGLTTQSLPLSIKLRLKVRSSLPGDKVTSSASLLSVFARKFYSVLKYSTTALLVIR